MRASHLEFRVRLLIMAAIIFIGFWSPWIDAVGIGRRISLLEWFALELSRLGLFSFTVATPAVIVCATIMAAVAATLRVCGTAWLGAGVVNHYDMKAGVMVAGGPFRFVRNPLYLGTGLMTAAMSFAMPVTGALFTLPLMGLFLYRLILGEEALLSAQLGEPYRQYVRSVPRLFPRLRSNLPIASTRPDWGRALLAESNPIGVFLILATLSWRYETLLLIKAYLVSFGVSLVLRAFLTKEPEVASA